MNRPPYKFYYLEDMTQDDLNKLALERNSYAKEIERLNNIINEFDKWLLGEKMLFYKSDDGSRLIRYCETKNKWLELKE